jgi:hypothetical protein
MSGKRERIVLPLAMSTLLKQNLLRADIRQMKDLSVI